MQLNGDSKLWGPGGFCEDEYVWADCLEDVGNRCVILPLSVWLQAVDKLDKETLGKTGVFAAAGEDVRPLLRFLAVIPVIALDFPVFSDGRSYSTAVQLKQIHHYLGELRAVGDVLIDQVSNMLRCGFDTLEVRHSLTQTRLAKYSREIFPGFYQPGASLIRARSHRIWYSVSARQSCS
ncbi:MAG: hypothetical protein JSC189_000814 [Candidatus Tokpelaia sp. JSC189]|nr:MAG: hypothetical protein JSC189_000814 [Candidatus Tokpelaia sp. JSC189]